MELPVKISSRGFSAALCAVFAVFALGWPRASASAQESLQKPTAEQAPKGPGKAEKPEKPANPAQIELLETKVRFETNGDSRKEIHALVKINNELGVRQFAQLNFDFNRSFEAVEIPLVHITHASGGTADILPSAITDQPNPAVVNAPAYQDVRVKSVRILGLEPGDTLEYRVVKTVSHHPLAPDFWLDHTFDRSGVVSQEAFDLDLPGSPNSTGTMPFQGTWNGPGPVVYVSVPYTSFERSGEGKSVRSVYHWKIDSSPKLPAAPEDEQVVAADVIVSTFSSWGALVQRLGTPLPTQDDHHELQTRLHAITPNVNGREAALRAAYDLVSQKLITVDLPVGATGFRLRSVKDTLDSGYATPEEKCLLLASFARFKKMDAQIVYLAVSQAEEQIARPSVLQRPLVVLSDGKKRFALDPSLEVAPYAFIPSRFRERHALSLTLYNGGDFMAANWMPLPNGLPFAAFQRVSITASLEADGSLTSKVSYVMRGDHELLLRVAFHQTPKEKWKEVAQLLALSDGFRGRVTETTASDPYETHDPFTVEYEITQPKFADWSKKTVRIPALLPQLGLPDPPPRPASGSAPAPAPIELGTPLEVETRMTLQLPQGTNASAPTGTSVERDYATYSSQYSVNGSTITASRHIKFVLRQIAGARAADYNAFLHAVRSDEAQDFTLERDAAVHTSKP